MFMNTTPLTGLPNATTFTEMMTTREITGSKKLLSDFAPFMNTGDQNF